MRSNFFFVCKFSSRTKFHIQRFFYYFSNLKRGSRFCKKRSITSFFWCLRQTFSNCLVYYKTILYHPLYIVQRPNIYMFITYQCVVMLLFDLSLNQLLLFGKALHVLCFYNPIANFKSKYSKYLLIYFPKVWSYAITLSST